MSKKSTANGKSKTVADRVYVYVDDIGNHGKSPQGSGNRQFGFGVAVVKDPDKYSDVSAQYKKGKKIDGEFKAKEVKPLREKLSLGHGIRKSGAKTYGYYVDKKKDTPDGWEQNGSKRQTGMLHKSLDLTLSKIGEKNVSVLIDQNTAYKNGKKVNEMSELLSEKHDKDVECKIWKDRDGEGKKLPPNPHMETTDVVSHAIQERVEEHSPWMSLAMGQKLKRLDENESIKVEEWKR